MKKLAFLGILFVVFAVGRPAHADGTWTGFYIGGNAGYAWSSQNSTLAIAEDGNCHFCYATDVGLAQNAGSPSLNRHGFTGGGQFGYNWQASNWVFGIESDFESFAQRRTVNSSVDLPNNTFDPSTGFQNCGTPTPVTCRGNFSTSVKTDWLLTVRPRIGYAWDGTLIYVTGGLALTRISFSQSYSDNVTFITYPVGGSVSSSVSQTKAGWTIGSGLEQALGDNWSLKAEYLYVRFSGLSAIGRLMDGGGFYADFTNNLDHLSANIVRIGINYRFAASPAAAKY